jgi:hypothetical protein
MARNTILRICVKILFFDFICNIITTVDEEFERATTWFAATSTKRAALSDCYVAFTALNPTQR